MKKIWKRVISLFVVLSLIVSVEAVYLTKPSRNIVYADTTADAVAVAGNGSSAAGNNTYSNLDSILDTYTPQQPENLIENKNVDVLQITEDITGDIQETAITEALGLVVEDADFYKDLGQQYTQKGTQLLSKSSDEYYEALANIGKASSEADTYALFTNSRQLREEGLEWIEAGARTSNMGNILGAISTGLDIYSVASDGISVFQDIQALGDLQNEHSSIRAAEAAFITADLGLSVVGILSTCGVITIASSAAVPLLVAGIVAGIGVTILHDEGFANMMNNTDNAVLDILDSLIEALFPGMKTPDGVNCYKPNIYIYNDSDDVILVKFKAPQLITTSIPEYGGGWTVTSHKDGTLTTEDGSTYGYLFYESLTSKGIFDTKEGFYIEADDREDTFNSILSEYGFNSTEIEDFIQFWNVMLEEDRDYIMYPQYTETVNCAMEIDITPQPDTLVRMWFVFEEYSGQEYETSMIIPFERDGYTIIEWGGMIF